MFIHMPGSALDPCCSGVPNTTLATHRLIPHTGFMDTRVDSLESDVSEIKGTVRRLDLTVARIEQILGRLEGRVEKLEEGQRRLEIELAELRGRVSQLPSSVQMIGFLLAVLMAGGIVRHFFG